MAASFDANVEERADVGNDDAADGVLGGGDGGGGGVPRYPAGGSGAGRGHLLRCLKVFSYILQQSVISSQLRMGHTG